MFWKKLTQQLRAHPLFSHASWMLSGGAVQAGVAFAANLALMRLLMPEDFGHFAIVLANIQLISAIIDFRIPDLILRVQEVDFTPRRTSTYWTALALESGLILVGSLIALHLFGVLELFAIITLIGVLISRWVFTQLKFCERTFAYRELSWIETGSTSSAHILSVVGAFFGMGPLVLYLREPVNYLLQLIGLKWVKKTSSISFRMITREDLRLLRSEISQFWADGMLQQLFDRLVILSLGHFAGERVTGYFSQAHRLALVPTQLLKPVAIQISFNYFSHRVPPGRQLSALMQGLKWAIFPLSIATLAAVLWANPIIPWLFGAQWLPVADLMVLLSGVILFRTPLAILRSFAMGTDRLKSFIIFGRAIPLVLLGLGLAIIYQFYPANWLSGIAISVSVIFAISVAATSLYYQRTV